jgi:hypothetical protein
MTIFNCDKKETPFDGGFFYRHHNDGFIDDE